MGVISHLTTCVLNVLRSIYENECVFLCVKVPLLTHGVLEHERYEGAQLGLRHLLDGRGDAVDDEGGQLEQQRVVRRRRRRLRAPAQPELTLIITSTL